MDKIIKVFILAACSVIIGAGGLWIYEYFTNKAHLEECVNTAIKMGYGALNEYSATDKDREQLRKNCLNGVYEWWRG